ncbi:arylamine N-acetyltransferase family protein [Leekyejoonella antrihumi]|uniref:Arylamine N-acetyltransferase n=1 Tax=Leekyejoonella antrihumi TaxID=1660198 RepID=A0A563E607_9MICO|nr:arylamine N-acetyltransferase [Leekyejoonella antrihumi]TWP37970.1 arylamine N-acetyltransferase [Leekyejoonella antrihumi]
MTDAPLTGESWRTDLFDIPAYLEALGVRPAEPTLDLLEALHYAHVHTLCFGNVDVLFGTHPGVTPGVVQEQLVRRRRGGYCFEHAQLFAAALEWLGFAVRRAMGRVHAVTNTRTHTTVIAALDGSQWLCDPGFGFSVTGPIALREGATRTDHGRKFSMQRVDDHGSTLWVLLRDGQVQHYIDELTVHPGDVRTGHFITSREPGSTFLQRLTVMRHLPEAHVTITERARTVRARGLEAVHTELSVDEVVTAVCDVGVDLDTHEQERLAAIVSRLRRGAACR